MCTLRPSQKCLLRPTRTYNVSTRAYQISTRFQLGCSALQRSGAPIPIFKSTKTSPSFQGVFRTSPVRHKSTTTDPQRTFADPSRPDLFYHLLDPPTPLPDPNLPAYALSFLEKLPSTPHSPSVIGWLPAVAGAEGDAGLNDFRENPHFRNLLHRAIREGLEQDVDEVQRNGALQLQSGWMHIHGMSRFPPISPSDERNIPALGRIGDPDDIIASVLVENGKILPETYQPMPAYRVVTADGVVQLSEGLAQKLKELLEDAERA
ncbi:uncharacterized protein SCHCODRAFT_02668600 [Schizophyllum commune H4-8]|uniref:Uncharacterized protein n=1 Tax=Schizophyllum commune (strain H4-8 / FGSC 9210) TaxID=578458 RepID=D8Q845_SCHCM|nr:uncharacterized protein SCHCODRAFT_02668600 [Schizophyllum commune H4-8]KAI5891214.1 hypothetical protein SCHCODRAFT_02668600 [Schizophyllum commune H4-8]